MRTALMVAEKPSLAASLANILSDGKCTTRKGSNGTCSVHEWSGIFRKEHVMFRMTSVCGHIMTLDFISRYNNWDRVDPLELFACPTEKKEATPKLKIWQFISQEARGCDYLVLWLDCDKEGENICYEVMGAAHSTMRRSPYLYDQAVWRAHFSAITEKDIKYAMNNLGKPNENDAKSVDARQELDLRIGCAFTRYQTKFFQGKYGDLDSSLISYGPCQTPTLGFCVQRHDEIQTFKPESYWVIQVNAQTKEGREVTLEWDRGRCFERDIALLFLNIVKEHTTSRVSSIVTVEKIKTRPQALNTVELMRVASSGLGMSPHHAMQIAEKLYTQGYISYPRTETSQYPVNFELIGALKLQQSSPDWGNEVKSILEKGINPPRKGADVGDHPPITPIKSAAKNEMDLESWKLYDYITRHFIATISLDCKFSVTTISFKIGSESFSTTGKTLIDPGYTNVMHWQALSKNESVPAFEMGEEVIIDVKMVECLTSPPDYLTEAELITLMEKHGIGTDASIPVHIYNICQRNYVTVGAGRRLIPTALGIVLVHGYQKIDPELVLPTMRSAVEEQLNLIAQGRANYEAVLHHTVEIFKLKFVYFVKNIEGMDQLFEVSFSPLATSGKAISRCGKCRRYMKHIQAKPSRLHCSHCDETYSLPQSGNVRIYKELKCPLDDFELLSWSTGARGKSHPLCPYCYNHPPFREMKKGSGCNACIHPNCPQSLITNGISTCDECEQGVLVLDPASGPRWKMVCSRLNCDVIIYLFEDAQKISVDEEVCICGAQKVIVEYRAEKSKLPNNETEMKGCLFCSADFTPFVEKHRAIASVNKTNRGRGRGRPKGRARQSKDKMAQLAAYFV